MSELLEGGMSLRVWVLLALAVACGEWLGLLLAQSSRWLSQWVTSWWSKRKLRRDLPAIERRNYAQREVDRQNLAL